jgi:histidine triad (HIT) family protein
MTDCIFCKIASHVIPSSKVYEDDEVYAFLDLSQTTKGHTLIIPKKHVADIFEYDEALAATIFTRVPKIARAIEKAFPDLQGLNVINNNREVAYQSVFHSHIHLIPRYSDEDDFSIHFSDNSNVYDGDALTAIAEAISREVTE